MQPIKWRSLSDMEERTLIFQPAKLSRFRKTALLSVPLFARTLTLCTKYLASSFKSNVDVKLTDDYIKIFWRQQLEDSFTSLYVTGRDQIAPDQTYVVMSNHESWMDIPAIFGAVPTSLRMVAKIGLTKIPVFGRALVTAGFIAIDRKNRSLAIRQLDEAKKRLAEGISIWIAPEGTRSRDGNIGSFKKGGFYLARELHMPILPAFIEGAAKVMPADGLSITPNQSITVHFCEPVSADEVALKSSSELAALVRARILDKQKAISSEAKEETV